MPYTDLKFTASRQCRVCKGTGRDPISDNLDWLPCKPCRSTGREAVQLSVEELAGLLASHLSVNPLL